MDDKEVRKLLATTVRVVGGGKVAAHLAGVSQPTISMIIHGKRPIPKEVLDFLGLEVAYVNKKGGPPTR